MVSICQRAGAALALLLILFTASGFLGRKNETPVKVGGTIYDPGTLKPLPGVRITWKDTTAYSRPDGSYDIQIPPGVREIGFYFGGRPEVLKSIVLRDPAQPVSVDVLLPRSSDPTRINAILADRGASTSGGKDLPFEFRGDSMLCVTDQNGNQTHFFKLGLKGLFLNSPVWTEAGKAFVFAATGVAHKKEAEQRFGVYRYDMLTLKTETLAEGEPIEFVDVSPDTNTVIAAGQHALYAIKDEKKFEEIHKESAATSFILSVTWGPDDRVYFTVNESVPIDAQRSYTRSRIASILPDGTELNANWLADPQYSFRYATRAGSSKDFYYSRFSPDGKEQSLWMRSPDSQESTRIMDNVLRAVWNDTQGGRFYYLFQNDLHMRDLKSGTDLTLLNSVESADMR